MNQTMSAQKISFLSRIPVYIEAVREHEQMNQAVPASEAHRHRKRKKRRSVKARIVRAVLVLLFFAAWGFGVLKLTQYLGKNDELGKQYHDVDPAGFDASLKSKY